MVKTVCVHSACVCVCVCGCVVVMRIFSGSIWLSWKQCGVRKTTSHKSGGSPMFYKDRTLLRMSLRKTLGLGPHVGCKACSLSFPLNLFPLLPSSLLIFHLVRGKKEEDKIDGAECGRQGWDRGARTDCNSICWFQTEEWTVTSCGIGWSQGGICCTLATAVSGNNRRRGEGRENRKRGG